MGVAERKKAAEIGEVLKRTGGIAEKYETRLLNATLEARHAREAAGLIDPNASDKDVYAQCQGIIEKLQRSMKIIGYGESVLKMAKEDKNTAHYFKIGEEASNACSDILKRRYERMTAEEKKGNVGIQYNIEIGNSSTLADLFRKARLGKQAYQ